MAMYKNNSRGQPIVAEGAGGSAEKNQPSPSPKDKDQSPLSAEDAIKTVEKLRAEYISDLVRLFHTLQDNPHAQVDQHIFVCATAERRWVSAMKVAIGLLQTKRIARLKHGGTT